MPITICSLLITASALAGPFRGVEVSSDGGKIAYYDQNLKKAVIRDPEKNTFELLDAPPRTFACHLHEGTLIALTYDGGLHIYKDGKLEKTLTAEIPVGYASFSGGKNSGEFFVLIRGEQSAYKVAKFKFVDGIPTKETEVDAPNLGSLVFRNSQLWLIGKESATKVNL